VHGGGGVGGGTRRHRRGTTPAATAASFRLFTCYCQRTSNERFPVSAAASAAAAAAQTAIKAATPFADSKRSHSFRNCFVELASRAQATDGRISTFRVLAKEGATAACSVRLEAAPIQSHNGNKRLLVCRGFERCSAAAAAAAAVAVLPPMLTPSPLYLSVRVLMLGGAAGEPTSRTIRGTNGNTSVLHACMHACGDARTTGGWDGVHPVSGRPNFEGSQCSRPRCAASIRRHCNVAASDDGVLTTRVSCVRGGKAILDRPQACQGQRYVSDQRSTVRPSVMA
jgi:hypothetical protein